MRKEEQNAKCQNLKEESYSSGFCGCKMKQINKTRVETVLYKPYMDKKAWLSESLCLG